MNVRFLTALILVVCLVSVPEATFAKKGEKNFRNGVKHEAAQQWEQAVQELVLADLRGNYSRLWSFTHLYN